MWWGVLVLTVISSAQARAEDTPAPTCDAWRDAPASATTDARALQDAGDAAFVANKYNAALTHYREAFAKWSHPKLRAALGLTLLKLERWVESADEFERALACGTDGLGEDRGKIVEYYGRAAAKTGVIVVVSTQEAAAVLVDGRQVMIAPGGARVRVMPGDHVVVAKRANRASAAVAVKVDPGGTASASPVLYDVHSTWRWARWKPWVATAAGVVIATIGIPLNLSARQLAKDYDRAFDQECPSGCPAGNVSPTTRSLHDDAAFRWRLSLGMFITGGLVTAGGLVLVALNRVEQHEVRAPDRFVVAPWTSGRGASVGWRF